jgi:hypothetical protein
MKVCCYIVNISKLKLVKLKSKKFIFTIKLSKGFKVFLITKWKNRTFSPRYLSLKWIWKPTTPTYSSILFYIHKQSFDWVLIMNLTHFFSKEIHSQSRQQCMKLLSCLILSKKKITSNFSRKWRVLVVLLSNLIFII